MPSTLKGISLPVTRCTLTMEGSPRDIGVLRVRLGVLIPVGNIPKRVENLRCISWPKGTKAQTSSEIDSWVKPESTFSFNLTFENLSNQGKTRRLVDHRVGWRSWASQARTWKATWFGSVSLSIEWDESTGPSNKQMIDRYRGRQVNGQLSESDCARFSKTFDNDFRAHEPKVYWSMVKAHKGFSGDSPVHYPWVTPAEPQAETFQWFTSNERGEPIPGRCKVQESQPLCITASL